MRLGGSATAEYSPGWKPSFCHTFRFTQSAMEEVKNIGFSRFLLSKRKHLQIPFLSLTRVFQVAFFFLHHRMKQREIFSLLHKNLVYFFRIYLFDSWFQRIESHHQTEELFLCKFRRFLCIPRPGHPSIFKS